MSLNINKIYKVGNFHCVYPQGKTLIFKQDPQVVRKLNFSFSLLHKDSSFGDLSQYFQKLHATLLQYRLDVSESNCYHKDYELMLLGNWETWKGKVICYCYKWTHAYCNLPWYHLSKVFFSLIQIYRGHFEKHQQHVGTFPSIIFPLRFTKHTSIHIYWNVHATTSLFIAAVTCKVIYVVGWYFQARCGNYKWNRECYKQFICKYLSVLHVL